jgi:nucleoside-diphosphate-sugar epimerase
MEINSYFITGGTGFLGSRLANFLVNKGATVHLLKRKKSNLLRLKEVENQVNFVEEDEFSPINFFLKNKIDCVIHAATDYGQKNSDPLNIIETNLILPLNILNGAIASKVGIFINTDTVLDKKVNGYSLSKSQFKDWLKTRSTEIIAINVALEHFYGPLDNDTKFTTFIIRSFLNAVEDLSLTKGEQTRDFIYVDDVILAFWKIIRGLKHKSNGFFSYQVGSGSSITIKDFVLLVKGLTGNTTTNLNFGAIPYRDNEVMNVSINLESLKRLGWVSKTNLIEGLTRTIEMERLALQNEKTTITK